MARRQTLLLALLLVVSFLAAMFSYSRMSRLREDAEFSAKNLALARADIDAIHRWKSSPGRAAAVSMDAPQLTAKLRQAAAESGLADAPGSEPGAPTRLANTDYSEMLVFLRFEPMTLKQLTTFLHTLARIDPSSRAKTIELSPPVTNANEKPGATELWQADVAVGYLTYTPQKPSR